MELGRGRMPRLSRWAPLWICTLTASLIDASPRTSATTSDAATNASTVYRWVQEHSQRAAELVSDFKVKAGDEWVADEIAVKVGGKQFWLFNVMDADSRFVLSAYLSPERTTRAAATAPRPGQGTRRARAQVDQDRRPQILRGRCTRRIPHPRRQTRRHARHPSRHQ